MFLGIRPLNSNYQKRDMAQEVFLKKDGTYGLLNFLGCLVCLGVAKPRLYTWVELYLDIHNIDCLHFVLGGELGNL